MAASPAPFDLPDDEEELAAWYRRPAQSVADEKAAQAFESWRQLSDPVAISAGDAGADAATLTKPSAKHPALPSVTAGDHLVLDGLAGAEGTDEAKARAAGYASGYDVVYGYKPTQKPLSAMTLDEVDQLQGSMGKHTPVGRYQFTRDTLQGLRKTFGLPGDTMMTPTLQNQFGRKLMSWSGYDNPHLSSQELQSRFGRTWASVSQPNGKSIDPSQPAPMGPAKFQALIAAARKSDASR
jgi:muramidase (phage lysozyme)